MKETLPPEGKLDNDGLSTKDALDYAWKWFEYHAGQRMLAFKFLLILMGALSILFYRASESGSHCSAALVAFFGFVVALAFFLLEWRNEQLVNVGREALKSIEGRRPFNSLPDPMKMATSDKDRCWLISHKFWLRVIEVLLILIFLTATCKALHHSWCLPASPEQRQGDKRQMPYIKQERRDAILAGAKPQNAGELNFAITVVVDNYLQDKGGIRYAHLNEVTGAMECAKLELYRRLAAPYEDKKIQEAGDVYKSNKCSHSKSEQ